MGIKLGKFFRSITTIRPQTMQTLESVASIAMLHATPEQRAEINMLLTIARARSQGATETIAVFEALAESMLPANLSTAKRAIVADFFDLLREEVGKR